MPPNAAAHAEYNNNCELAYEQVPATSTEAFGKLTAVPLWPNGATTSSSVRFASQVSGKSCSVTADTCVSYTPTKSATYTGMNVVRLYNSTTASLAVMAMNGQALDDPEKDGAMIGEPSAAYRYVGTTSA